MRRFLLPLSAAVFLASCAQASVDDVFVRGVPDDAASSSSAAAVPDGWLTHGIADYGMSFAYPPHFGELHAAAESYGKNYGLKIEDNAWAYDGQIMPLLSLRGNNVDPTFEHSLRLEAYPLHGYSRVMMYDDEYAYDHSTKTWTTTLGGETKAPESVTIGGRTAYVFPFGDAGHSSVTYAIPLEEKGVVIELTYSSCVACLAGGSDMAEDQATIDANAAHADEERRKIIDGVAFTGA